MPLIRLSNNQVLILLDLLMNCGEAGHDSRTATRKVERWLLKNVNLPEQMDFAELHDWAEAFVELFYGSL